MFYYSIKRQTTPGPLVQFDCPKCGAEQVFGSSFEWLDTFQALHVFPLYSTRNTYIWCSRCQAQLTSPLTLEELHEYQNADLTGFVAYDVSFVYKFLAIAALLLCWMPILGIVLSIIALAGTFRVRGWPRTLALISAVPALLTALLGVVAAFIG